MIAEIASDATDAMEDVAPNDIINKVVAIIKYVHGCIVLHPFLKDLPNVRSEQAFRTSVR